MLIISITSFGQSSLLLLLGDVATVDVTAPAIPTDFIANAPLGGDAGKITLTWADPGDGDLDQILIYMDTSFTEASTLIDSVAGGVETYTTADTFNIGGLYSFRLKASDDSYNTSNYTPIRYEVNPSGDYWYADRDASGSGSGLDWANAEVNIRDALNNAIAKGDIIYVSGGADSTRYDNPATELWNDGDVDGWITVRNSWEANHNGDVHLIHGSGDNYAVDVNNCRNLRFTGFIINTIESGQDGENVLKINDSNNIMIDSCLVISNGTGNAIFIVTSSYVTIDNCTIVVESNDLTYEQDNLIISAGIGGHTITNNTFTHEGYNNVPHFDMIQLYNFGDAANLETVIANNFFYWNIAQDPTEIAACIYGSELDDNRFLIYNNIMASIPANVRGIDIQPNSEGSDVSVRIFNNTIITGDVTDPVPIIISGWVDTLIIKNNIIFHDSAGVFAFYLGRNGQIEDIDFMDVDYNHYYTHGGGALSWIDSTGNTLDWGEWQALGFDANGDTSSVTFADIWGTDIVDYITTTGRDGGVDLSVFFGIDINGYVRPFNSVWDLGAIEYNE